MQRLAYYAGRKPCAPGISARRKPCAPGMAAAASPFPPAGEEEGDEGCGEDEGVGEEAAGKG
ncbi:MAG: hypothetical protein FWG50_13140, partial [Kiritimatiellaeota bacterium]|nr:hypothetical protein [Kiritimatiellota bacterium]